MRCVFSPLLGVERNCFVLVPFFRNECWILINIFPLFCLSVWGGPESLGIFVSSP
jgi:hypothetical protein